MKKDDTKQKKQKEMFIEQLRKTPIVQIICERLEIGRTTFYRWKRQDAKFSDNCNRAMEEGLSLVNDLAESQLINAMKNQNLTAVMYWLNHRHNSYRNKLELSGNLEVQKDELTKEQEQNILRALKLASLIEGSGGKNEKTKKEQ